MDNEAEYNNRARVPEHPQIIAGWSRDATAFRASQAAICELGVPYGGRERERYDFFAPADAPHAPVVAFIHGGYWQALDRSQFSHLAMGAVGNGVAMALPSYDLCPIVPFGRILGQMRAFCLALWRRTGRPLVVAGHSAGGHLAATLLATDWPAHAAGAPRGLVCAAYAISGLFDLEPLVPTSINAALKLDPWDARIWSPARWRPPSGLVLDAVVGGAESSEFLRQSRMIADIWGDASVHTRYREIAGADHFTVLAPLADPNSEMTGRLVHLAGNSA